MVRIMATVLILGLTSACGSNAPTTPSGGIGISTAGTGSTSTSGLTGAMSMRVDTTSWTATSGVFATRSGGVLSVGGTDPTWNLGFAVTANAPGTFVIPGAGAQAGNNALLVLTQGNATTGSWSANAVQGSGTVVITSLTATAVTGTFTFAVLPASGTASGVRNVTDGTFTINF